MMGAIGIVGEVYPINKREMCDRIVMPDGAEYDSVRKDGKCLCNSRDREILEWIVNQVGLAIGMSLIIERDPFGWVVSMAKNEENM